LKAISLEGRYGVKTCKEGYEYLYVECLNEQGAKA